MLARFLRAPSVVCVCVWCVVFCLHVQRYQILRVCSMRSAAIKAHLSNDYRQLQLISRQTHLILNFGIEDGKRLTLLRHYHVARLPLAVRVNLNACVQRFTGKYIAKMVQTLAEICRRTSKPASPLSALRAWCRASARLQSTPAREWKGGFCHESGSVFKATLHGK